jgi:hypothetical protein
VKYLDARTGNRGHPIAHKAYTNINPVATILVISAQIVALTTDIGG